MDAYILAILLKWGTILIISIGMWFLLARNMNGDDVFTELDDIRRAKKEIRK